MIKKIVGAIAAVVVVLSFTSPLFAQPAGEGGGGVAGSGGGGGAFGEVQALQNPIKYDTFSELAEAVIETAVEVLTPFLVMAIIYAGFLFVKAQGNEAEITRAKGILLYTVIGAAILMGAWGFAQIIGNTISTITQ